MVRKMHIQTQEEWEVQMAEKILSYIRNDVYLDLRYFGVALSALEWKPDRRLRALATDGRYLLYAPEHVMRIFRSNPLFLDRAYLHVVLHCLFFHLWTAGKRERYRWNIACDIAVEYTIDHMDKRCTKRALSWIRQKIYTELEQEKIGISAVLVYRYLKKIPEEQLAQTAREFYTDDHSYWPKEQQEQAVNQPAAKQWNQIARQTKIEQKKRGTIESEEETLLAAQMKVSQSRRSYRDFLRQFSVMREELVCDPDTFDLNYYTYGLRIYQNMPLIEPVESKEVRKIQEFVIVIDTSYSTSGELVKQFLRETYAILTERDNFFRKCHIRILSCDNQVRGDRKITNLDELEAMIQDYTLLGGGGTDFRPAFGYVNTLIENGEFTNLCGLLYFTDGKGTYPKKRPDYKSAFLFLNEYDQAAVPPWAISLSLEMEEFQEQGTDERKEEQR